MAEGAGRALLASSETNYPGWKALVELNGSLGERPLELVNHAFKGLVLNAGESKALLVYVPATFRLGLFLCLMVWGFWTSLLLKRMTR